MPETAVSYHDYIALLAQLDESDSFRVNAGGKRRFFEDVHERFIRTCERYHEELLRNCGNYAKVTKQPTALDHYLYKPVSYVTFGRADFASLILVDDFEPVLAIPLDVRSPVESISIGFSPRIDSLDLTLAESKWITSLPELISRHQDQNGDRPVGDGRIPSNTMCFQQQLPLMAMTSFKSNGTAVLGEGMAFTLAIYRAVARCVSMTLEELRQRTSNPEAIDPRIMTKRDVESFQYTIIEPQGADDMILFMPCTNYSVAVAVINAIRTLTLADVYWSLPSLLERVLKHSAHHSICRLCEDAGWHKNDDEIIAHWSRSREYYSRPHETRKGDEWTADKLASALCGNHVFSRTATTLGASFEAFDAPDSTPINGLLEPALNMDISCGHNTMVLQQFNCALKQLVKPHNAEDLSVPIGHYTSTAHFSIGAHDTIYSPPLERIALADWTDYADLQSQHRAFAMPTATYLLAIGQIEQAFSVTLRKTSKDHEPTVYETGLLDLSTTLCIPYPRSLASRTSHSHFPARDLEEIHPGSHAPLVEGLRMLRTRICPEFVNDGVAPELVSEAPYSAESVKFDLGKLRREMRRLDFPVSLRRTIQYLYYDFVASLADTHAFHAVIDLYDVFATLFVIITDTLPQVQRTSKTAHDRRLVLNRNVLDSLCDVVRAIQSAVGHRIATTRFHDDVRCADVVFRGGLNRIMSVIDVPLKCGIEIVQLFFKGSPVRVSCLDVGAVALLATRLQTLCKYVSFGADENGRPEPFPCIAHVELSVSRVFAPHQYTNLLHEALHYVREIVGKHYGSDPIDRDQGDAQQCADWQFTRSRADELFVHLCMNWLVFRGDWELFVRYTFMELSNQPDIRESEAVLLADTFLEIAAQTFLAADAIERSYAAYGDDFLCWPGIHPYAYVDPILLEEERVRAQGRFGEFLQEFGVYFAYWDAIVELDRFRDRQNEMFTLFWHNTVPRIIDEEYRTAYMVVRRVLAGETRESLEHLDKDCLRALDERLPGIGGYDRNQDGSGRSFVTYVCGLLHAFLRFQYRKAAPGSRIVLSRDFDRDDFTGTPHFPPDVTPHVFQVDPATDRLRCSDPDLRKEVCGRSIAVIKGLWDVSTVLRARRVGILVASTAPAD